MTCWNSCPGSVRTYYSCRGERVYMVYNLLICTSTDGPVGRALIWLWECVMWSFLWSLVQFPLLPLFYICQISHDHVIYYSNRWLGSCLKGCIIVVGSYLVLIHEHSIYRCKCEPEVVRFNMISSTTTSLASKCEWRWFFSSVWHNSHHHYLPCVQTQARGSHFHSCNMPPTTTTSLMCKCKPEVVFSFFQCISHHHLLPRIQMWVGGGFFILFRPSATTTTSLTSKHELEVVSSTVPTICHHHHLPRIQTRAKGGFLWLFQHVRCHHLSCVQTRAGGGHFSLFRCDPGWLGGTQGRRGKGWRQLAHCHSLELSSMRPPLICEGVFFYGLDKGAVFISHATPFDFFLSL